MPETKRIALLIGEDLSFGRRILSGIHRYARPDHPWVFRTALPIADTLAPLIEWHPTGIIVQLHQRELLPALRALGKPIVNVSAVHTDIALPRVANDDRATGALAARYLLDRHFIHLAFCGYRTHGSASSLRQEGFCAVAQQHGVTPRLFEYTTALPFQSSLSWIDEDLSVRRWLRSLPTPVGILAYNDLCALRLSEVCHQANLRVPEDVAIVGVDNDELKCLMAYPPLSSVDLAAEQIGFQAARLLDHLMAGMPAPVHPTYLAPIRLVSRGSSDMLAIREPEVAAALHFITEHAHEAIHVDEVAEAAQAGRRWLERRFRAVLNRSIVQEVRRQRIDRVKDLLSRTTLSLAEIAVQTGFANPKYLALTFRQETGMTPSACRSTKSSP